MDVDQAARSNAQEYFGVKDPDFYEFEGTVIYDSTKGSFRSNTFKSGTMVRSMLYLTAKILLMRVVQV